MLQTIGSKRRPVVNSQELNFPKSPPVTSGVVHALPHYARYKASEVQLLSRRWSSLHWPSALPLLRAGWCSCALYATIATVRLLCIVHPRASDFFLGAAALSSSRSHTPRELEGLGGADSFETVTYVTLTEGGAGVTGSWEP